MQVHQISIFLENRVGRLEDLQGGDAAQNARIVSDVLAGNQGPKRDIVILNSAYALVAAGLARACAVEAAYVESGLSEAPGKLIDAIRKEIVELNNKEMAVVYEPKRERTVELPAGRWMRGSGRLPPSSKKPRTMSVNMPCGFSSFSMVGNWKSAPAFRPASLAAPMRICWLRPPAKTLSIPSYIPVLQKLPVKRASNGRPKTGMLFVFPKNSTRSVTSDFWQT